MRALYINGDIQLRGSLTLADLGDGVYTRHDALYCRAESMQSDGAFNGKAATDAGVPRWELAAGQRVKGSFDWATEGWEAVAFRWEWENLTAGAGTVTWQLAYRLHYAILETDLDAGAMTNIAIPAIAASGQYDSLYQNPSETAAIPTPSVPFFGSNLIPSLEWALTRTGGTLAGAIGITEATITRVP